MKAPAQFLRQSRYLVSVAFFLSLSRVTHFSLSGSLKDLIVLFFVLFESQILFSRGGHDDDFEKRHTVDFSHVKKKKPRWRPVGEVLMMTFDLVGLRIGAYLA